MSNIIDILIIKFISLVILSDNVLMKYSLITLFILVSLLWSTPLSFKLDSIQHRSISSQEVSKDLDYDFQLASFAFESLQDIEKSDLLAKKDDYEFLHKKLEDNLYSDQFDLKMISRAALILYHFNFENVEEFSFHMRALFISSDRCESPAHCLFYMNLVTTLAQSFDLEGFGELLERSTDYSSFSLLIKKNVILNSLHFTSREEERIFEYILKSNINHLNFEYRLKKNLHQLKDLSFFSPNWKKSYSEIIERETPTDGSFLKRSIAKESDEVTEILLDPNYSLDNMRQIAEVWRYRNRLFKIYLKRLDSLDLREWYKVSNESEEDKNNTLKRYHFFEVKLPSRNEYIDLLKLKLTEDDRSFLESISEFTELINQQVINFFENNYQSLNKVVYDEKVLELEKNLYYNQKFSHQFFFGFYFEMNLINIKASEHTKMMLEHQESVSQKKTLYQGSFDYYYQLQNLDKLWLHNKCQVSKYSKDNRLLKTKNKGSKNDREVDKFISPFSKKVYRYQGVCEVDNQSVDNYLIKSFAVTKAKDAALDALIIGDGSTLISVLGWFGAFRITSFIMSPLAKISAKKAALYSVGSLAKLNKKNFGQWIKYIALPSLAINYIGNSLTMAFIRSNVASAIDMGTGASRSYLNSFGNYLKTYTIMYLSIPPVGYLVTKVGVLFSPITNLFAKSKSILPKFSKVKYPSKVTHYVQGSIDSIKLNIVESIKFLPVLYVYDAIDYFKEDKAIKIDATDIKDRAQAISSWIFVWQVMNHSISRRFGPSNKQVESKLGSSKRSADGAEGGGDGG